MAEQEEREALLAILNREGHAPMSTHDPRDGSCLSCPWPIHEMPADEIADAILAAGWRPDRPVGPSVEDVERAYREAWADFEAHPESKIAFGRMDALAAVLGAFTSGVIELNPGKDDERCPECGGINGAHGLVHERFPEGGGGTNRPCSRTAPSVVVTAEQVERTDVLAYLKMESDEWMRSARRYREGSTAFELAHHAASVIASIARRIETEQHVGFEAAWGVPVTKAEEE